MCKVFIYSANTKLSGQVPTAQGLTLQKCLRNTWSPGVLCQANIPFSELTTFFSFLNSLLSYKHSHFFELFKSQ